MAIKLAFGAMLALLLVVALSVPVGPGATPGSSVTFLQIYGPLLAAGVGIVVVLVLVIRWLIKDRQHEREVTARTNVAQQAQLGYMLNSVTARQSATVDALITMNAQLIRLGNGRYAGQIPGGPAITIEPVEAEYWAEIAPERVAGYLPERRIR